MLIFSEGVKHQQYAALDKALPPGACNKQDAVVTNALRLQLLQADLHLLSLLHQIHLSTGQGSNYVSG